MGMVFLASSPAQGHHYLRMSTEMNNSGFPDYTWAMWQWVIDGGANTWRTDFTDPTAINAFRQALADWETAFSANFGTKLVERTCPNGNIVFKRRDPSYPCPSYAVGCFERGWGHSPERGGYYLTWGRI